MAKMAQMAQMAQMAEVAHPGAAGIDGGRGSARPLQSRGRARLNGRGRARPLQRRGMQTLHGWIQRWRRARPEGIRITKVGLWYVLFTVLVAIAATNTGNNALYLVVAVMLGVLVLSGLVSRHNVRGLDIRLLPPDEVFAHRPFRMDFEVKNRSRLLPHWHLLVALSSSGQPRLIPYLPRGAVSRGSLELILPRRGYHRLGAVHVASIFPFGFFRKGVRYAIDLELLVFPEIFSAASHRLRQASHLGSTASRQPGWGHDLHALRAFRQGDDPRSIHWKQTARTGNMIFMEREAEKSQRLSILFDNAVGPLKDPPAEHRFERLVSEAATAAVDYLAQGYEVELVTRDLVIPFGSGLRQRRLVLEALALIGPRPRSQEPLASRTPQAFQLRLALEPQEVLA